MLNEEDLAAGFGEVYLPFALEKNTRMPDVSGDGSMFFRRVSCLLTHALARHGGIIWMKKACNAP